jgi:hypothetical protein
LEFLQLTIKMRLYTKTLLKFMGDLFSFILPQSHWQIMGQVFLWGVHKCDWDCLGTGTAQL